MDEPEINDREAVFARLRDEPTLVASVDAVTFPQPVPSEPDLVVAYGATPPLAIIPLAHPFTIDGIRVRKVELRQPTFADVERVVAGTMTEHEMHANMAGVSVAALRAMRWSDGELVAAVARHIAPELRTV